MPSITTWSAAVAVAALGAAAVAAAHAGARDRALTISVAGTWTARADAVPPASQLAERVISQRGQWNYVLQGYSAKNRYDNIYESELRDALTTVEKGRPAGRGRSKPSTSSRTTRSRAA